ncbi:MAG: double-cubane-cluster-containing anaerobic reductase [Thermoguttaceae bacterium]|jgi:benzoyl-CoA reductase/2-hydroxyglutaryl-CoA dehydratase subunit BcrC/BadD/HgdB
MAESCCNTKAVAIGKGPFAWFDRMIEHCYEYAKAEQAAGRPVVGIMCEYTPRELIMAAGAVPVCLCGGSAKTIPAAEQYLPANLCPLIKSTYGFHVERSNPFLEMADLVVGETTCDGKKKMYELMAESRPMYVLELPHKSGDADALQYWIEELREFRDFLSKRFSTEITDDKIRQSICLLNRERALRRELAGLMKSDHPPLSGRQLLDCKSSIWAMPEALRQYELVIDTFRGRCGKALSEKECDSPAVKKNGRVRVQMTGVPMVHGAERVIDIVENCGGTVVAMENCTGLKPLLDDVDENAADPLVALAEKYFHLPCSVMTPNDRRLEVLGKLAADYRPECVIELIWQACLTYDVESHRIRRYAEEELGLPYLRIETDYSPSDSARIAVRVEALFETVRARRSAP